MVGVVKIFSKYKDLPLGIIPQATLEDEAKAKRTGNI
jgi:hypothetical protein